MALDETCWMPAWLALLRTHARLWDEVEGQLRREYRLTMARYDVLMHLDMAEGRLGLTELGAAIILSPSGLSKLLDRMTESGLIVREQDSRDARSAFALLTPLGRSLVRKARRKHHAFLQELFGNSLTERDAGDLARILGRVSASIANQSLRQ